jgi:hypothetical protein
MVLLDEFDASSSRLRWVWAVVRSDSKVRGEGEVLFGVIDRAAGAVEAIAARRLASLAW